MSNILLKIFWDILIIIIFVITKNYCLFFNSLGLLCFIFFNFPLFEIHLRVIFIILFFHLIYWIDYHACHCRSIHIFLENFYPWFSRTVFEFFCIYCNIHSFVGAWLLVVWFLHCLKSAQIQSFFWSVFSCIRTEYGDLRSKSPYSVQM